MRNLLKRQACRLRETVVAAVSAASCSRPPRLPKACSPRRVASGGRMELMGSVTNLRRGYGAPRIEGKAPKAFGASEHGQRASFTLRRHAPWSPLPFNAIRAENFVA